MRLIVGLGNPGIRYRWTRHNLGFWLLDQLAENHQIAFNFRKFNSVVGEGSIGREKVILAKPQTYMNRSGTAVEALVRGYSVNLDELIVCCDDAALPIGRIRIRERGSDGGHKGLRSIIEALNSEAFNRIRIGIAKEAKGGNVAEYVLAGLRGKEKLIVKEAVFRAAEAIESIITKGVAYAMNKYNSI